MTIVIVILLVVVALLAARKRTGSPVSAERFWAVFACVLALHAVVIAGLVVFNHRHF